MHTPSLTATYIGGPTALLEIGGVRLLTDPAFDEPGQDYTTGPVTLHKIRGPAVKPGNLGRIDAALISHEHHFDNLDRTGREVALRAGRVITTREGAGRLGSTATGLAPWETTELGSLRITATPAQHGPAHMDRGPVIGFVLEVPEPNRRTVYVSGDTVWFEGVESVARRFDVDVAILFLGAARVEAVGPFPLTMTSADAVEAARAFPRAKIVPLHYEGWKHFTQSRGEVQQAFDEAGLTERLHWLQGGQPTSL